MPTGSESAEWMAEHKGEFVKTVGYVWSCGDDECNCTQAMVDDIFRNKVAGDRWIVRESVWEGSFLSDGEMGAHLELAEYRRSLHESDPEREASIEWAVSLDYGLTPA